MLKLWPALLRVLKRSLIVAVVFGAGTWFFTGDGPYSLDIAKRWLIFWGMLGIKDLGDTYIFSKRQSCTLQYVQQGTTLCWYIAIGWALHVIASVSLAAHLMGLVVCGTVLAWILRQLTRDCPAWGDRIAQGIGVLTVLLWMYSAPSYGDITKRGVAVVLIAFLWVCTYRKRKD